MNHLLRCLSHPVQSARVPSLRLLDEKNPPPVDIFVTCAGEDINTITNTVEAACALDYPCHRVIVLDDANSEELSKRLAIIKLERPMVFYTARKRGTNHHFKAGNLKHGYRFVEELEGGAAPFIAALDADMIPDPKWLRALMPHLLTDPTIALIQPPQRFYDVPTPDLLLQSLDVLYRVTEPLKEAIGSTWCGGSGYVVRRTALESIGGFPVGSIGEDMYCSNVLHGKGWKTRYVDESLQYGRVPDSYTAHTKQQSRWHVGKIQTAIAMGFYLRGQDCRYLSVKQRAVGLIATALSLANFTTVMALSLLPVVVLIGQPLIVSPDQRSLHTLLLMACASTGSAWLDDCVVSLITGYRIALAEGHASYWIAPYHAVALMDAFLPKWLHPRIFEFSATGSGSGLNERDRENRPPLKQRLVNILWNNKAAFHVIYLLVLSVGVARNLMASIQQANQSGEPISRIVLTHVGWPPLLWVVCLISMSIPMIYAFFPPVVPKREELLKRDPDLRASYPSEPEGRRDQPLFPYLREDVCYTFCALYSLSLMGLSGYVL